MDKNLKPGVVIKKNIALVRTDGATVGHNGKLGTVKEVGIGVYINKAEKIFLYEKQAGISNNEAEFKALIKGMEICLENNIKTAIFQSDSKIVVNRAKGKKPYKSKFSNERMDKFQERVLELVEEFDEIYFDWIPREQNETADRLSKKATKL